MINIYYWLDQPADIRRYLAQKLEIPKSGQTVVEGGRLVSDGHTPGDFLHMTEEKMQKFTGSHETDVYKLFASCVKEAVKELYPEKIVPTAKPVKAEEKEASKEDEKIELSQPVEPGSPEGVDGAKDKPGADKPKQIRKKGKGRAASVPKGENS